MTVFLGLTPVATAYIAKLIIDHIAEGRGLTPSLWWLVAAQLALTATAGLSRYGSAAAQEILRERTWHTLSLKVMRHAAELDLEFFERPESHDALAKAQRELGFRPMMATLNLLNALQGLATVLGFILVILTLQPVLVLVLLVALVPALVAANESGHITFSAYDMTTSDGRRAAYFDTLLASDGTAKEVRLYNLAPYFLSHRHAYATKVIDAKNRAALWKFFAFARADIVSVLVQYAAFAFIVVQAVRGHISIGDFVLLSSALAMVRTTLANSLANLGEVLEHSFFFRNLTDFLAIKPSLVAPEKPKPVPKRPLRGIVLENVTFAYPGAKRPVFENLSLELRAGEATALVGVNGAGKTTLVKLITRLYEPQEGRITLDGIDIRDFEPKEYRKLFAVILQDFVRYQLSVRENIALAKVDEATNQRRLEKAAREANILTLIESLRDGWDTFLGRQFEATGQELSGGQWQRIALARVLYRDAPILIFDEPTAALDAEAEAELLRTYRDLTKGKLSLLITHRFNTVKMADRIIVLEHGQVIEDGTHSELMHRQGRYFQMFTIQASTYNLARSEAEAGL